MHNSYIPMNGYDHYHHNNNGPHVSICHSTSTISFCFELLITWRMLACPAIIACSGVYDSHLIIIEWEDTTAHGCCGSHFEDRSHSTARLQRQRYKRRRRQRQSSPSSRQRPECQGRDGVSSTKVAVALPWGGERHRGTHEYISASSGWELGYGETHRYVCVDSVVLRPTFQRFLSQVETFPRTHRLWSPTPPEPPVNAGIPFPWPTPLEADRAQVPLPHLRIISYFTRSKDHTQHSPVPTCPNDPLRLSTALKIQPPSQSKEATRWTYCTCSVNLSFVSSSTSILD